MRVSNAQREYRRQCLREGESELEELVAFDYEVVQLSDYHFRINGKLDVWPSSKKWYHTRTHRKGNYKSLKLLVKEVLQHENI